MPASSFNNNKTYMKKDTQTDIKQENSTSTHRLVAKAVYEASLYVLEAR